MTKKPSIWDLGGYVEGFPEDWRTKVWTDGPEPAPDVSAEQPTGAQSPVTPSSSNEASDRLGRPAVSCQEPLPSDLPSGSAAPAEGEGRGFGGNCNIGSVPPDRRCVYPLSATNESVT